MGAPPHREFRLGLPPHFASSRSLYLAFISGDIYYSLAYLRASALRRFTTLSRIPGKRYHEAARRENMITGESAHNARVTFAAGGRRLPLNFTRRLTRRRDEGRDFIYDGLISRYRRARNIDCSAARRERYRLHKF